MKIISDQELKERKEFMDYIYETKRLTYGNGRKIAEMAGIPYTTYDNYTKKNSPVKKDIREKIVQAIQKINVELQEKINAA